MKNSETTGVFGIGREWLSAALRDAGSSTRQEILYSENTEIYVYHKEEKEIKAGGEPVRKIHFYRLTRDSKSPSRFYYAMPEDSRRSAFMDEVIRTGLMFVRDADSSPEHFAITEHAMQALCGKISLAGKSAKGNRTSRNVFLADSLLMERQEGDTLLDNISFVCRDFRPGEKSDGLREITGVTSTRYCGTPRTAVISLVEKLEKLGVFGQPEIGRWCVMEWRLYAEILFPEKAVRTAYRGGKEIVMTPAVLITDSNCGGASWTMDGMVAAGDGRKELCGRNKRHDRDFDPVKVTVRWLKEDFFPSFASYTVSVEKMRDVPIENPLSIRKAIDRHGENIRRDAGKRAWERYREKAVLDLSGMPCCTELDVEIHLLHEWDNSGKKSGRRPRNILSVSREKALSVREGRKEARDAVMYGA